jgi:hypothetical protein
MNIRKLLEQSAQQNRGQFNDLLEEIGLDDSFQQEGKEIQAIYPRGFSAAQQHMMQECLEIAERMAEFGNLTDMMPQSLKHFCLRQFEMSMKGILKLWGETKDAIIADEIKAANDGAG